MNPPLAAVVKVPPVASVASKAGRSGLKKRAALGPPLIVSTRSVVSAQVAQDEARSRRFQSPSVRD